MYTYKRAVGINRLMPRGEELLDISAIQTKDLFTQFDKLIIVFRDELAFQDVAMDASYYQNQLTTFTGVIQDWLTANASVPLITSNKLPGSEYRFVTCHDIQYKWFSLLPGDVSRGDDHQEHLTVHNAPDIRVVKTDGSAVEYDKLVSRSLWTVNNHLVRAVEGNECIYLLNAGRHFNINDNIHVTSLNFNTVSELKTYPITREMIQFEGHDTYNFLHVTSPVSLKGKTVWASIGGRLYLNDVLQVRGENSMAVRTELVDWFSRIFDSKDWLDLENIIPPERQVVNEDFFSTEDFFVKLLTNPSSFLIVLDNPHLYTEVKPLITYQYPFTYLTEEKRPLPLLTGGGLLPKYFTRKIINRRLLDINIGTQRKYLNEKTGPYNEGHVFHGYTNRYKPSTLHTGYILKIRGLIQED